MPGMQWLGAMPEKKNYLAEALDRGTSGFVTGKAQGEKRALGARTEAREERRLDIAETGLKKQLATIDYEKKRDAANMVISVAKTLRPDAADEFINKGEIKALFEDLKWPLPTKLHGEVDFKEAAQEAVLKGEPLPNMTMDETKKAAGSLITPTKVTATDVKDFKDAIPWWESLSPGMQVKQREWLSMKKRRMDQFSGGGGGGRSSDPLNARGR